MATFNLVRDDIDLILSWLFRSGEIALAGQATGRYLRKSDRTIVTRADVEIEDFLVNQIREHFPEHNIISEERHQNPSICSNVTWVIDPLDGTSAYVDGLPGWAIAIGILINDEPAYGFHYIPRLNEVTFTNEKGQVLRNGNLVTNTISRRWGQQRYLAVGASSHKEYEIAIRRCRTLGCVSTSIVYNACGLAGGALVSKAFIWDLAAAAAILKARGGILRYLNGQPVEFTDLLNATLTPEPLLSAAPEVIPFLSERIIQKS